MKAALAFCFLFAIPAFSQSAPPKVRMGSRVPSVSIRFAAQGNNSYTFLIQNRSARSITAFDVLLVPSGIPRNGNRFLCQNRCSESSEIDTIDTPAIKAGGTAQLTYDMATVTGGAVIVEAAIFDDGAYGGRERAAADLIADQLGNQAEFDRIVSAVDHVLNSAGPQNAGKGTRLESELSGLPVDVDSATMEAFYRWFPNLRDCNGRFPQIMKGVSTQEKANVQAKLQTLLSAGDPSDTTLTQWWSATEQYLAGFGCSQCTAKMASPNPPVQQRMVSVGCSGQVSGSGSTVQAADDSEADDDGTEQAAGNDADPSDMTTQDSNDDELSMTEEPGELTAPVASANPSVSAAAPEMTASAPAPVTSTPPSTRARHIPIMPKLIPFGGIPRAAIAGMEIPAASGKETLRPVADEQLYSRYFRYVVAWEDYLSAGGTPTASPNAAPSPDPYPVKMNESKRTIVAAAAYDYRSALRQSMTPVPPGSITAATAVLPVERFEGTTTWAQLQWQMQWLHSQDGRDERTEVFKSRLERLRLQLGKTSFRGLDDYVHGLYHASPGRLVREPLSETAMYTRYLYYIASLDKFAAHGDADGREAAKVRADEQKESTLSDKDEGVLQQVADDYQQQLGANRPNSIPPRTSFPVGQPATTAAGADFGRFAEERQRIADSHIAQLRSGLGEDSFRKVEKRVHELYKNAGHDRVIPVDAPEAPIKVGELSKTTH